MMSARRTAAINSAVLSETPFAVLEACLGKAGFGENKPQPPNKAHTMSNATA